MRFDLREEAITEFLGNIEKYTEELHINNLALQKQLNEILSQTQYELLQKMMDEIVRNYNENVIDASRGILVQWSDSENTLKAIMHHYRVGEQAEEVCSDLDKKIIDKFSQNLSMISLEYEKPERPKVSQEDFECAGHTFRKYEKEAEEIYSAFRSKIEELTKENEIYLCVPALVSLLQKKNIDFVEFAQERIEKLQSHIEKELNTFSDEEESNTSILSESSDDNRKTENSNLKVKKFLDKLHSLCKEKVPNAVKKVWNWIKEHPEERKEILQLLSALLNSSGIQSVSEGTKLINKLINIFTGEKEDEVKDEVDLKKIDAGISILKELGLGDNFFNDPDATQKYVNKIAPDIQKIVVETLKKPEYQAVFEPIKDDIIDSPLKNQNEDSVRTGDVKNTKSCEYEDDEKSQNGNLKDRKIRKFIDKLCSLCKDNVPNAVKKVWNWIETHPEERKAIWQLLSALLNSSEIQSVSEGRKLINKLIKIFAGEKEDEVKDEVDLKKIDAGMLILKELGIEDGILDGADVVQEYVNKISPGIQKIVVKTLNKPEYRDVFHPDEYGVTENSLESYTKEKKGEINKIKNNDSSDSIELDSMRKFINKINTLESKQDLDLKSDLENESLRSCLRILKNKGLDKIELNNLADANKLRKAYSMDERKYDDTYSYDYDFNSYNPDKLKKLSPRINSEEVEKISNKVGGIFNGLKSINRLQEEKDNLNKKNQNLIKFSEDSQLGSMIKKINQMNRKMDNPIPIREENGEYDRRDVELLLEELDEISEKDTDAKDFNRGISNFMKRKMGYPATDYNGRNIIKKLQELIPSLDNNNEEFIIQNPQICDMVSSAKKIKDDDSRRKEICEGLRKNKGILNLMGIALVVMLLGSGGPIAAICVLLFGSRFIKDDTDKAYSELVLNLGEDRTNSLLNNYSCDGNKFIRN